MKKSAPQKSTKSMPSARAQAHTLLGRVLGERLNVDEALAKQALVGASPDQRFSMLLVMTVLQHLGQLDAVIAPYLDKPLPTKRLAVSHALRLGVAQLLLLDTPSHAAVNETVALVKAGKDAGFAGLVNAVLQKIAREKPALPAPIHNLPLWLRTRWQTAYGVDNVAVMAEVARRRAPLDIHLISDASASSDAHSASPLGGEATRLNERSEFSRSGEGIASDADILHVPLTNPLPQEQGDFPQFRLDAHILRLTPDHPPVESLPGYDAGAFFVQDVAASYPVRLLGDMREHQVLDICAAPGGKTMQMIHAGAFVTAIDRSAARMKKVKENLKRMNMQANTIVADAFQWQPSRAYDAILLDALCTATGTWRRHPEVVQLVTQADITEMVALQRALLLRVWDWLKPGGRMVYCVCSLEAEVGEEQAAWFMGQRADAMLNLSLGGDIPAECRTAEGYLRTTPAMMAQQGGMDGFFGVCFIKKATV